MRDKEHMLWGSESLVFRLITLNSLSLMSTKWEEPREMIDRYLIT